MSAHLSEPDPAAGGVPQAIDFVVLIHGTWDPPGEGHWTDGQVEGTFAHRLLRSLEAHPTIGPDDRETRWRVESFIWSGDNTHEARVVAAEALSAKVPIRSVPSLARPM